MTPHETSELQSAFDYAFHKESLLEIMRITSGEARLYPLVNFKAERSRIFAELKNDPDFADFIFEEVQTDLAIDLRARLI